MPCALLLLLCHAEPVEATPVLPPATFDTGLAPWIRAYGDPLVATTAPHSGAGCLEQVGAGGVKTELIPYAGQHLRFSWWVRTEDVQRGANPWNQCLGQVVIYDAEKKAIRHFDSEWTLGTTPWTPHSMDLWFEAKQHVAFVQLQLLLWDAVGTAWFDDARLDAVPTPELFRKVPPLAEVEDHEPVRWPLPRLEPLVKEADTGRVRVTFDDDGTFHAAAPGGPTVSLAGVTGLPPNTTWELGTTIHRGYMTQQALRFRPPGEERWRFEGFVELFRGSPIVSIFKRLWLDPGDSGLFGYRFDLEGTFDRMVWFQGDAPVRGPIDEIALPPETTTKPFVVYHDTADTAGVVFYLPHPAELRRWFIEDYLVDSTAPVAFSFGRMDNGGARVALTVPSLQVEPGPGWRTSLDCPVFVLPYRGSAADALKELHVGPGDLLSAEPALSPQLPHGYWQPRMPANLVGGARLLRMARYFPTEFTSWIDGGAAALTYGHEHGFAWGNMTQTMKGIRTDPLSPIALARDHAWRMLTFFVEAGKDKGAPPGLSMHRAWAENLADPNLLRTAVFCQYWEYRVAEARRLMQSPLLTDAEKARFYEDLQRAKVVYDPASPATWTVPTPHDGVWFKYLDVPCWPENQWVINTHTTSVGNVGEFALLARDLNQKDDEAFWRDLFVKGIDGLLYATGQDWMWYVGEHDPNELRYGGNRGGPNGYHRYMITDWVPRIIDQALQLAPDRVPPLLELERRMMKATFVAGEEATQQRGREVIEAATGQR